MKKKLMEQDFQIIFKILLPFCAKFNDIILKNIYIYSLMDNNILYVAYNNNIILGIFDNEQTLNYNLDGCLQKGFIQKKCIKIEKYIKNSFVRLTNTDRYFGNYFSNDIDISGSQYFDISGNQYFDISYNQNLDVSGNIRLDVSGNQNLDISGNIRLYASGNKIVILTQEEKEDKAREELLETLQKNKLSRLITKKKEELEKSDEYMKIQQDRIDLVHKINELKMQKKKIEEDKNAFTSDLQLYKNLLKEKEKRPDFKIPELFESKFKIFSKLEEANTLNYEDYKIEWDIVKPKNNYNLFSTTTYEDNFSKKANVAPVEIDLEI